jgi:hypothetical protein
VASELYKSALSDPMISFRVHFAENERLGAYGIGPDAPLDVSPPINGDATHQLALSSLNCD